MSNQQTRRQVLRAGITTGTFGVAGCTAFLDPSTDENESEMLKDPPVDVRGAIYIPTKAYNIFQMWRFYDPKVIERDMKLAQSLGLNAIRTWLSWIHWAAAPQDIGQSLEHLLTTADEHGIKVLLGLFDAVGESVNPENRYDQDPRTAVSVVEPPISIMSDPTRWDATREYVNWFMDRHRNDDRLLAISLINEPGWDDGHVRFARGMFKELKQRKGSVPLTISSTSLANIAKYAKWGIDVLQLHYNFPKSPQMVRDLLADANELSKWMDKPVWLSEWQRVRSSGGGFGGVKGTEWQPNYSSLAPVLRDAGVGNFFWSLMLKPAWTPGQRKQGTISGVFHEDGAVWDLEDARAIKSMSGDRSFDAPERTKKPDWMKITEE